MLVLSRKEGESLVIGDRIVVTVVRATGGRVKLGVQAPRDVNIRREELAPKSPPASRYRHSSAADESPLFAECW